MGTEKRTSKPGKYLPKQAQKKNGHPTQPGNRSNASYMKKRKRKAILYRILRNCKIAPWEPLAVLGIALFAVIMLLGDKSGDVAIVATVQAVPEATEAAVPEATEPAPVEYVFRYYDGTPVNWQATTNAWATEAGMEKRYELTDAERWEVASVVTAEANGEPYAGKLAVAQCILQACEDDGIRPDVALKKYGYTKNRPEPSKEALKAVQAVFDFGQRAATDPIKYFYAPARVESEWHETQDYVMTINGHRFFAEN